MAVTGGIAEGKSTVLQVLASLGVAVANADEIAAEILEQPHVRARVASLVGLHPDFSRKDLRDAILAETSVRRAVNSTMHPLVLREIVAREARAVEVPLLCEACLTDAFPYVWVVTCGREEQLRRLSERLDGEFEARSALSWQLPTRAKLPFADAIVRTNRDRADVHSHVTGLAGAFCLV
ncbi:MAG: dephospho-CoA kinase [Fimbriimonadaceae bacterium]